jgi:glycosyltransferase involved in cell wall biosynthesis
MGMLMEHVKSSTSKEHNAWDRLHSYLFDTSSYSYPRLTLIICTHNDARSIGITLESLISQKYPDLEIIIIDATSHDKTLAIAKNFQNYITRIYSVSYYNIYEMMNWGISLASGEYLSFLFPGDFYTSQESLHHMMRLVISNDMPDLAYCGCLLRDDSRPPRIMLRPLHPRLLSRGRMPSCLQSFFFNSNLLHRLGKFRSNYTIRGGLDLLCRFCQQNKRRHAVSHRILIDSNRENTMDKTLLSHSRETLKIVSQYFGLLSAMKYWFTHSHFKTVKWLWKKAKRIFIGI